MFTRSEKARAAPLNNPLFFNKRNQNVFGKMFNPAADDEECSSVFRNEEREYVSLRAIPRLLTHICRNDSGTLS
jgi:hypothetical protein